MRVKAGLLYVLATAIVLAKAVVRSILYTLFSTSRPSADLAALKVTNCAALMLISIYIIVHVLCSVEAAKLFR